MAEEGKLLWRNLQLTGFDKGRTHSSLYTQYSTLDAAAQAGEEDGLGGRRSERRFPPAGGKVTAQTAKEMPQAVPLGTKSGK